MRWVPRPGPAEQVGADVEGEAVDLGRVDRRDAEALQLLADADADRVTEADVQRFQGVGVAARHPGHDLGQPLEPALLHLGSFPLVSLETHCAERV